MTPWKNLVVALVAAFALAACSSSDNGTDTSLPTDPPPPTQAEQDLKALQDQIAALRKQLGIDDTANIGTTIADLQRTRDALQKQLNDQAAEATMKEALAIATMLAAGTPAGADNSAGLDTPPTLTVTATRTASGTKIMVTGFESTDTVTAPMIGGLASDVQMRKTPAAGAVLATEETIAVYTDIEAPMSKSVDFDDYYNDSVAGEARRAAAGLGNYTAGMVATLESIPTAARAKFTSSNFPMGSRKSYTYGTGDDDQADASDGIAGYFDGVKGMYACTSTCSVTNDQDGNVQTFGGSWTFTPDSRTAMVTQVTPDSQYLFFGWWQRSTETAGGDVLAFDPFYSGTNRVTDVSAGLTGEATYMGPATGKYATKTFNDGALASAMAGEFTATAMLTADFDEGTSNTGKISGEVMDFMANGGSLGDWSVMLEEVDLGDSGAVTAGLFTGTTASMIGDAEGTGSWMGQFFGGAANGVTGDAAHPKSVAGEFTADFPAAHISGAFGANLQ